MKKKTQTSSVNHHSVQNITLEDDEKLQCAYVHHLTNNHYSDNVRNTDHIARS